MDFDHNIKPLAPLHVGEVLREEFLNELNLTAGQLAKACFVPRSRIERIVREEIGVTVDTALRLARFFGTSPEFWLNLQKQYDIKSALLIEKDKFMRITPLQNKAA